MEETECPPKTCTSYQQQNAIITKNSLLPPKYSILQNCVSSSKIGRGKNGIPNARFILDPFLNTLSLRNTFSFMV